MQDINEVEQPYGATEEESYTPASAVQKGYSDDTSAEMAGTALTLDLDDAFSEEKYDQSKKDLMTKGDSEHFNYTLQSISAQELLTKETALDQALLDPNVSEEEKDALYFNYEFEKNSLTGQTHFPDIVTAQIDRYAAQTDATLDEIMLMRESEQAAFSRLYTYADTMEEEAGVMDYLGAAVPFNYNKTLWGGLKRAFPGGTDLGEDLLGALLPGEMVEIIVEQFINTPRTEWPEKVALLLEGMQENSGYFGTNDAILAEKAKEIADKLSGEIEVTDLDATQLLDNVFGIADASMVGGLIKTTVKGAGKFVPKSTASNISKANPDAAKDLTAGSIANPKMAQGVGTTSENAAFRGLAPKFEDSGELIEQGVRESLERQLDEANTTLKEGLDELDTPRVYTDNEVEQISQSLQKALDKMAGIKHSPENSVLKIVERNGQKEIDYQFTYTKGENKLFDSAEEAITSVKQKFPSANVEIREVNMGTKQVSKTVTTETSVQTIQRRVIDAIENKLNSLMSAKLEVDNIVKLREQVKNVPSAKERRGNAQALKEAKNQAKFMAQRLKTVEEARAASAQSLAKGIIKRKEHQAVVEEVQYTKTILDEAIKVRDDLAGKVTGHTDAVKAQDEVNRMGGIGNLREELKRARSRAQSDKRLTDLEQQLQAAKKGNYDGLKGEFAKIYKSGMKPNSQRIVEEEVRYGYIAEVRGTKVPSEADKVMFGDMDIVSGGRWLDYLLDPASRFSKEISRFASTAIDRQAGLNAKLYNLTNAFVKLKARSQAKVAKALAQGDKEGKVWTITQLRGSDFALDAKEIQGYFAIRNLEDVIFSLKDYAMAKELKANGNSWIKIGEDTYAGKPRGMESNLGKEAELFDPITGGPIRLDDTSVRELYRSGGMIVDLDTAVTRGNRRYSKMVVSKTDGARISEVPAHGVLNKLDGHISRVYDEKYFITVTRDGFVDGVKKPGAINRVLRVAGTRKEADEIIKELNALEDGASYDWKYDRNLGAQENQLLDRELDKTRGVLKHTGRGEHLRGTETLANIEDPVEAIRRSTDAISRTVTSERMLSDLKSRWLTTFGNLADNKYPTKVADIAKAEGKEAVRVEKARRMWNYIDMMENNPTGWDRGWANAFVKIGEFAERKGIDSKLLSGSLDSLGRHPADKLLRGLAFNLFIVLNPFRQFFLQSQQILFLGGLESRYMLGGIQKDWTGLLSAFTGVRMGNEAMIKSGAKMMGVSTKEMRSIVKGLDDSGLIKAIDQHAFARDGLIKASGRLQDNFVGRAVHETVEALKVPLIAARKLGFEAGEANNIMATFLVSRHRYLKANPKASLSDRRVLDEIAGDARNLSLSMNRAGEMPYQKGWLGNATQFLSVQHKAISTMFVNQGITTTEKFKIAAGQLALWGTSGLGLGTLYEKARDALGIPINPVVDDILRAGAGEFAVNAMLQQITGDDSEVSVASTYAAGSGFFNSVFDLGLGALEGNVGPLELVMGPSFNAGNRALDVIGSVSYAFRRPELSTSGSVVAAIQEFTRMSSGMNNFVKFQMNKNLQAIVDRSGNPIVEATYSEMLVAGTLGLQPRDVEDYYRILNAKGGKAYQDKAQEEATRLYSYWKNELLVKVDMEKELGKDASLEERQNYMIMALLDKHDTMIKHSMALYDEDFALAVQEHIRNKLLSEQMELKSNSLYDKLVNSVMKGTSGNPVTDTITIIQNSQLPDEQKQQYIDLLEGSVEGLELLKEVNASG